MRKLNIVKDIKDIATYIAVWGAELAFEELSDGSCDEREYAQYKHLSELCYKVLWKTATDKEEEDFYFDFFDCYKNPFWNYNRIYQDLLKDGRDVLVEEYGIFDKANSTIEEPKYILPDFN